MPFAGMKDAVNLHEAFVSGVRLFQQERLAVAYARLPAKVSLKASRKSGTALAVDRSSISAISHNNSA